jgi:hypothetical protein
MILENTKRIAVSLLVRAPNVSSNQPIKSATSSEMIARNPQ